MDFRMINIDFRKIRIFIAFLLTSATVLLGSFTSGLVIGNSPNAQPELPLDRFDEYAEDFSSHLPLIVMQTDVSLLYDRDMPPRTVIWLFDREGENRLTDTPTDVFQTATANYRGNSSLYTFPKKGYKINLYNSFHNFIEPLEYGFLGLAPASEWVLRSPYADKSLLRDWFSYELAATVLDWQPRGKPIQLFLQDGEAGMITYQGVYFFCENITAGEARLDIGEFQLNDFEHMFEGGGYIFQQDHNRDYSYVFVDPTGNYRISHPSRNDLTSRQDTLLKNEIAFFNELIMKTGAYENIAAEDWDYGSYIDVGSFIDYFLLAELTKNVDMGRVSAYMYRPVGGKLVMGPLWDNDWCLGNFRFSEHYAFFYPLKCDRVRSLIADKSFALNFADRWNQLRNGIWSNQELLGLFDTMTEYLTEPAVQNARRWPEIYEDETYVWSNPYPHTDSWEEEIARTRTYLIKRLEWLDEYIPRLVYEPVEEMNNTWYFDNILSLDEERIIILAVKDEASYGLSDSMQNELFSLGLRENLAGKYRYSYAAIIDGYDVVFESLSEKQISHTMDIGGRTIKVSSAGYHTGNVSSILIDSKEHSLNRRGINIVIVNKTTGEIVDSVTFDIYDGEVSYK